MGFLPRMGPARTARKAAPPVDRVPARADHVLAEIDGEAVRVALNWSARARRYTLKLNPASREPTLTIPIRGSLAVARDFLDRHRGWLKARLAALPNATPLADGATIPLRGELHRIRHVGGRGLVRVERDAAGAMLLVPGAAEHLPRRLTDFLKRLARADLEAATARHAAALGVRITAIRIGDPGSRWGSCSSSGAISYSWRIVMAPPAVLDYLAAHEVAHRKEMNHSARFWRLVKSLCPQMETAEAWLARHGASLHAVGADAT